jgi:hypothetical protein
VRWERHVVGMGKTRKAFSTLVEKREGKRKFGIPRCRWEDNTNIYLRGYGVKMWTEFIWFWIKSSGVFL